MSFWPSSPSKRREAAARKPLHAPKPLPTQPPNVSSGDVPNLRQAKLSEVAFHSLPWTEPAHNRLIPNHFSLAPRIAPVEASHPLRATYHERQNDFICDLPGDPIDEKVTAGLSRIAAASERDEGPIVWIIYMGQAEIEQGYWRDIEEHTVVFMRKYYPRVPWRIYRHNRFSEQEVRDSLRDHRTS